MFKKYKFPKCISGRTNAAKLYHKAAEGELIRYIDICSLYPFVNKYMEYPTGHPTVITENFAPVNKSSKPYKGLIKCRVLPPRGLLHPVLPTRIRGKLLFTLCKTCADTCANGECAHTDAERSIWGAWPHVELNKAIDLGYEVGALLFICFCSLDILTSLNIVNCR